MSLFQPSDDVNWTDVYTGCFRKLSKAEGSAYEQEIREHIKNPTAIEIVKAVRSLKQDKDAGVIKFAPNGFDVASRIRFNRGSDWRDQNDNTGKCFCCDGWQYVYPRTGPSAFNLTGVPCTCHIGIKRREKYKVRRDSEWDQMIRTANRENLNFTEVYTGKNPKLNMVLMMIDAAATCTCRNETKCKCKSEEGLKRVKELVDDIAEGRLDVNGEWDALMERAEKRSREAAEKQLAKEKASFKAQDDSGADFAAAFPASFVDTEQCPFEAKPNVSGQPRLAQEKP